VLSKKISQLILWKIETIPVSDALSQVRRLTAVPAGKAPAESLLATEQEETDENLSDPSGDRDARVVQQSAHDFFQSFRTSAASGYFPVLSGLTRIHQLPRRARR
jgi:hypothetical protein